MRMLIALHTCSDMEAERVDGKVDVGFAVNNHDGCNFT